MRSFNNRWLVGLAGGMVLAGCGLTENFRLPKVTLPPAWNADISPVPNALAGKTTAKLWWEAFGSKILNDLEKTARVHNFDVQAALARLSQADAQLRMTLAPFLPTLGVKASDQIAQSSSHTGSTSNRASAGDSRSVRTSRAGLVAGYDVDLFGKRTATVGSAAAMRDAMRFDRDTVVLTLAADLATTYFKVLTLKSRRNLMQKNQETARHIQKLVRQQVALGKGSPLDLIQQQNIIATLDGQMATLQWQYAQARNALALLAGQSYRDLPPVTETLTDLRLPTITPGLPADLLRRRPDIQRAEANLRAAHADMRVARAALFPAIQLTGERGYASNALKGLLAPESILWSFGAALTATIFDNGQTQGAVDLAEAKHAALVAAYQQAILSALRDVDDNLAAVHWLQDQEMAMETAVTTANEACRLARVRYQAGATDYLTVLDAERTQLKAEDDLIQTRQLRLNAAVSLFKALGGGMSAVGEPIGR